MKLALEGIGYDVVNVDYPSTEDTIEVLAERAVPKALAECPDGAAVHFVTHSMGGIILRHYMTTAENRPEPLGRVVMLGPPNKGSEVVDRLGGMPGFELLNGVAGKQLGTGAESLPNRLGPVDYQVGIVAGNKSISPVFSRMLEGPDDGKVTVASTRLEGMADHIVLPVTHTFMMNSPAVFRQVAHFLREGAFKHD